MEYAAEFTAGDKIKAWIKLSRPPFQTVGVLPFTLGSIIAWSSQGHFDWALWAWGRGGGSCPAEHILGRRVL
jgi:hypothetical protein